MILENLKFLLKLLIYLTTGVLSTRPVHSHLTLKAPWGTITRVRDQRHLPPVHSLNLKSISHFQIRIPIPFILRILHLEFPRIFKSRSHSPSFGIFGIFRSGRKLENLILNPRDRDSGSRKHPIS